MGVCESKNKESSIKMNNISSDFFHRTAQIKILEKREFELQEDHNEYSFNEFTTNNAKIEDIYEIEEKVIGEGFYGIIRRAKLRKGFSNNFVVKSIYKEKIKNQLSIIRNEMSCFQNLDHPHIVTFFESFQDTQYFHMVLEYLNGGSLEDHFGKAEFNESFVKQHFFNALLAINHMHSRGIAHRDIKLENFVFKGVGEQKVIKLLDFGLSKKFIVDNKRIRLFKILGTPNYVAPEVLTGDYDEKCDIWSAGILLLFLLTKRFPYKHYEDKQEFYKAIVQKRFHFPKLFQGHQLSSDGKDLVKKMLVKNPNMRISMCQAIHHPWFRSVLHVQFPTRNQLTRLFHNISEFQKFNFFKKVVLCVIARFLSYREVQQAMNLFYAIDKDRDGIISYPELRFFVQKNNIEFQEQDLIKYVQFFDQICCISYSQKIFQRRTISSECF